MLYTAPEVFFCCYQLFISRHKRFQCLHSRWLQRGAMKRRKEEEPEEEQELEVGDGEEEEEDDGEVPEDWGAGGFSQGIELPGDAYRL